MFSAEENVKPMLNRKFTIFIAFLSLSVAGSFIKIPAIVGSVAFDSMPALAAGALMSPLAGMAVGCIGHLMSAGLSGFPLGPLHLLIAVQMGLLSFCFGILYRRNFKMAAILVFIVGNGIAAPLCFWPVLGKAAVLAFIPGLVVAAVLNGVAAHLLIPRLRPVFDRSNVRINHENKS
ncbi:alpha-ribazole transporter [Bacillus sp. OV194]|nr:alpha-ribazole transporter [Bacillus sp. OV194]